MKDEKNVRFTELWSQTNHRNKSVNMVLGYKKVAYVLLLMLNIGPEGNKSMT